MTKSGLPIENAAERIERRNGTAILRPRIFEAFGVVNCAMSTRVLESTESPFGMNISFRVGDRPAHVERCRAMFFSEVGVKEEHVAVPGQVHSDRVMQTVAGGRYPGCDAMVTDRPGVFVAVTVADCVPILLADPVRRVVAAVHAGWRGSRDRILERALSILTSSYGCEAENLHAYIGPSAGGCCYEVGGDVAGSFPPEVTRPRDGGKFLLDLKWYNREFLLRGGVQAERIAVSPFCTICNPELFHSYRRDNDRSGRMIALIGYRGT